MKRVTVAPGLVLDEEMYELACVALVECAPEQVRGFTWEKFAARPTWTLVPDMEQPDVDGPWYKAEASLKSGPPYDQTIKLNVWRKPDLRRTGQPMPHSHPWEFTGILLLGGYDEDRYDVERPSAVVNDPFGAHDLGLVDVQQGITHRAGQRNHIPLQTFHEVTKIHEPGRTVSLMDCDFGRKNGWGHLDPETGLYTPVLSSPAEPGFKERLHELNPHLASRN